MRPKTIYVYKDFGNKERGTYLFDTSQEFLRQLGERRIYCKNCRHSVVMDYKTQETICSHCNHKIKKEGKILFKDKMRVLLNEEKYEKRN